MTDFNEINPSDIEQAIRDTPDHGIKKKELIKILVEYVNDPNVSRDKRANMAAQLLRAVEAIEEVVDHQIKAPDDPEELLEEISKLLQNDFIKRLVDTKTKELQSADSTTKVGV